MKIPYTKEEQKEYAKYLIERFGSVIKAANVIDEMVKVCPTGTDRNRLLEVRTIIFTSYNSTGL